MEKIWLFVTCIIMLHGISETVGAHSPSWCFFPEIIQVPSNAPVGSTLGKVGLHESRHGPCIFGGHDLSVVRTQNIDLLRINDANFFDGQDYVEIRSDNGEMILTKSIINHEDRHMVFGVSLPINSTIIPVSTVEVDVNVKIVPYRSRDNTGSNVGLKHRSLRVPSTQQEKNIESATVDVSQIAKARKEDELNNTKVRSGGSIHEASANTTHTFPNSTHSESNVAHSWMLTVVVSVIVAVPVFVTIAVLIYKLTIKCRQMKSTSPARRAHTQMLRPCGNELHAPDSVTRCSSLDIEQAKSRASLTATTTTAAISQSHQIRPTNPYQLERMTLNERLRGTTDEPITHVAFNQWEFPRQKLRIISRLGEGCFGQVWKCEVLVSDKLAGDIVAVKTLKETSNLCEKEDLLQELSLMKNLGHHPNVVKLLGCCTEKDPIFIIMEYMSRGTLLLYLRDSRSLSEYNNLHGSSESLTSRHLIMCAYQVARGMEYISTNGIIHRDLAARNILVSEDRVCKIADFGFSRGIGFDQVYEKKTDRKLPIRWMAPEFLFGNVYSVKSDVWSYGILLWEIVTLGATPYQDMTAQAVMEKIKNGYRLGKPDNCDRELYNLMYYCWSADEKDRPDFREIVETLEALLVTDMNYIQLERIPEHSYYNWRHCLEDAD